VLNRLKVWGILPLNIPSGHLAQRSFSINFQPTRGPCALSVAHVYSCVNYELIRSEIQNELNVN
jgi:hypothetical protein